MTRVIKVGGRPQSDPALIPALAAAQHATFLSLSESARASREGLVVVHGGGDEVSTLQRLYGVTAEFKGGRRVTSALDIELIRMALSGSANKRLVSALVSHEVRAIGLSGVVKITYDDNTKTTIRQSQCLISYSSVTVHLYLAIMPENLIGTKPCALP